MADIVDRPKVRKGFPGPTDESVAAFLARVRRIGVFVTDVAAVVTLSRDPRDEKYLNLAVAAGATVVVSRDKDLLGLMTGTDPDAARFRTEHPGIAILDPATFLRTLRPTSNA